MARPQKPIISRDRAVRAALEVIDTHGLEGFSLSLVADRLGVKAPSLYYHFKSREELLSGAARLLLIDSPMPPLDERVDWRQAVIDVSLASWRSVLRHPRAAPLLLQFFPRHLLLNAYEHWATLFKLKGIPTEWHLWILEGTEKLCFGSALFAAASRVRALPPFPSYDNQTHPNLTAAIRANHESEQGLFVVALRNFLDGIPDVENAEASNSVSTAAPFRIQRTGLNL